MDKRLLTGVSDAILVAVVSAAICYPVPEARRSVSAERDRKDFVVANSDVPIGAMITAEHVRSEGLPVNAFPGSGFATLDGSGS